MGEGLVLRARLVRMVFRIKKKLDLIVEDLVVRARLVRMVFRIKKKLDLIVGGHVLKPAQMLVQNSMASLEIALEHLCVATKSVQNVEEKTVVNGKMTKAKNLVTTNVAGGKSVSRARSVAPRVKKLHANFNPNVCPA